MPTPPAELVIILPVLGRPHRVRPLLESIHTATTVPHRVNFVGSSGDKPMLKLIRAAAEFDSTITLDVLTPNRYGDYAKKVNAAYRNSREAFMFIGADDLAFHPGWFEAAMECMADPTVGVVGTQDLAPTERARAGDHATHCLVRRSYIDAYGTIDEPGKVLHEGYWHEYVDDEFVATARVRGAWSFAHGSVVEHLHPSWGKAPKDRMYAQQKARMAYGRAVFERRRVLWESEAAADDQGSAS